MSGAETQLGTGRRLYQGWMLIVARFGEVQTLLILSLVYTFVIGPMAIIAGLAGKDLLHKRLLRDAGSVWNDSDTTAKPDLERARRLF